MCGLFGFSCYGQSPIKNLSMLTNSLAEEAAIRGTDATGIAFMNKGIQIQKEAKSAYALSLKHPEEITALIGHTRHATHGDQRKNFNNHPFYGKAGGTKFALAHNGVLCGTESLIKQWALPRTKIETDSYIAVQLIEKQRKLSFDSLRTMAETVSGSFSFSILDENNTIWLVKGDSPLSILHFPALKMYVYASTKEILYKGIVDSPLFTELQNYRFEEVPITDGTIMKISANGQIQSESFFFRDSTHPSWWEYGFYSDFGTNEASCIDSEYLDAIKNAAYFQGIDPDEIDELVRTGFSLGEIEDMIYEI